MVDVQKIFNESGSSSSTLRRGIPRPPKASDLSKFNRINKAAPLTFSPTSVFEKGKEEAKCPRMDAIQRTSSGSNMFPILSQVFEIAADASAPKASSICLASWKPSIDLWAAGVPEAPLKRNKKLLLPRRKLLENGGDGTAASSPVR